MKNADMVMVTVTSRGQLVVPARFRRELGIHKGTRVSVTQENGQLILQPVTRKFIRSLHGCLKGEPNLLEMLPEEGRREREREKLRA